MANTTTTIITEVIARCPKCKRKKIYYSDQPLNHTPYCPFGCGLPMLPIKSQTRISIRNKTKKKA